MDPETMMHVEQAAQELYEVAEANGWTDAAGEVVEHVVENIEEAVQSLGDTLDSWFGWW